MFYMFCRLQIYNARSYYVELCATTLLATFGYMIWLLVSQRSNTQGLNSIAWLQRENGAPNLAIMNDGVRPAYWDIAGIACMIARGPRGVYGARSSRVTWSARCGQGRDESGAATIGFRTSDQCFRGWERDATNSYYIILFCKKNMFGNIFIKFNYLIFQVTVCFY